MSPVLARIVRTCLQAVGGGALYGLQQQLLVDLDPAYTVYLVMAYTGLVAICQIVVEEWTGKALFRPART